MPSVFSRPRAGPKHQMMAPSIAGGTVVMAAYMRLALMAIIAAASFPTFAVVPANAQSSKLTDVPYCTLGLPPLIMTQFFEKGKSKVGTVCTIPAGSVLRFDGATLSPVYSVTEMDGAAAASMSLLLSKVEARAGVFVRGAGSEATGANAVPYIVTISGNSFAENSAIVVEGSFGKGSDTQIFGNFFHVANLPNNAFSAFGGAFGIMVCGKLSAAGTTSLRLYSNARLRIYTNSFNVTTSHASTDKANVAISFQGKIVPQADGGTVVVDNNILQTSYFASMHLPEVKSPAYSLAFNVSRNQILASPPATMSGTPLMVVQRTLDLGKKSRFWMHLNTFNSQGGECIVYVTDVTLSGEAQAFVTSNVFTSNGGTPAFGFQGGVKAFEYSNIIVERNSFYRIDNLPAALPCFFVNAGMALEGMSVASISYNTFAPQNKDLATRTDFFGIPNSAGTVKSPTAVFFICYNMHYGEEVTNMYISGSDSNTLAPILQGESQCSTKRSKENAAPPTIAPTRPPTQPMPTTLLPTAEGANTTDALPTSMTDVVETKPTTTTDAVTATTMAKPSTTTMTTQIADFELKNSSPAATLQHGTAAVAIVFTLSTILVAMVSGL